MPDKGGQWEPLCRGGPNGLFMVALALAWWATALGEVSNDDELSDALDDTIWAMQHMARSLKAGGEGCGVKRARDGSLDGVAAKR